jgi:hypothetical protein
VSRFTDGLELTMLEQDGKPLLRDGRVQWRVAEPLVYDVGAEGSGQSITVPAGAITDLASIPRFAWSLGFPPDGGWTKAAVVHDRLYELRGDVQRTGHPAPYTRAEADAILREAMGVLGVPSWQRAVIWSSVRLGGAKGWGS